MTKAVTFDPKLIPEYCQIDSIQLPHVINLLILECLGSLTLYKSHWQHFQKDPKAFRENFIDGHSFVQMTQKSVISGRNYGSGRSTKLIWAVDILIENATNAQERFFFQTLHQRFTFNKDQGHPLFLRGWDCNKRLLATSIGLPFEMFLCDGELQQQTSLLKSDEQCIVGIDNSFHCSEDGSVIVFRRIKNEFYLKCKEQPCRKLEGSNVKRGNSHIHSEIFMTQGKIFIFENDLTSLFITTYNTLDKFKKFQYPPISISCPLRCCFFDENTLRFYFQDGGKDGYFLNKCLKVFDLTTLQTTDLGFKGMEISKIDVQGNIIAVSSMHPQKCSRWVNVWNMDREKPDDFLFHTLTAEDGISTAPFQVKLWNDKLYVVNSEKGEMITYSKDDSKKTDSKSEKNS